MDFGIAETGLHVVAFLGLQRRCRESGFRSRKFDLFQYLNIMVKEYCKVNN
jgi:hypothetical protein